VGVREAGAGDAHQQLQRAQQCDRWERGEELRAGAVGGAVAEQPPAKAKEVMWLAKLRHAGPLPAREHLGGVTRRGVGVAFCQHHLMAAAAGGQGRDQAGHPHHPGPAASCAPSTAVALLDDHSVGVASVVASTATIASMSCPRPSSLCPPKNMPDERHAVNLLPDAWRE